MTKRKRSKNTTTWIWVGVGAVGVYLIAHAFAQGVGQAVGSGLANTGR